MRETEEMRQTKWEIGAYIAQLLSYRDATHAPPPPPGAPTAPGFMVAMWRNIGQILF